MTHKTPSREPVANPLLGDADEQIDAFENGEMCLLCYQPFAEPYGRPLLCEDCGGDGVLKTYED